MKHASVRSHAQQRTATLSQHRPVTGSKGVSIAPPAYGIDFVDQQLLRDEEMTVQRYAGDTSLPPEKQQENRIGLPDYVKAGIKSLSGFDLSDVQVHYNSPKPAQLHALAYTQGSEIHVAPGQEKHLPHEAWHVVQQKQGRVQPTMQAKGTSINDDNALEAEAESLARRITRDTTGGTCTNGCGCQACTTPRAERAIQRQRKAFSETTRALASASSVRVLDTAKESSASSLAPHPKNANGNAVVQRYCGTPGCNNPNCHDEANHGFDKVYPLRGRTVYYGNINAGDIGTGTGTNQTTRNYVNNISYPEQVSIEYNSGGKYGTGARSEFVNQPLVPGQRADAGHIFGNQYGGYGNQSPAVFPQHPQTNRGNYYNGEPTRDQWRAREDEVRSLAQQGFTVANAVTISEQERVPYYCQALTCNEPLNGFRACAHCGKIN